MKRKERAKPGHFDLSLLKGVHTVRAFDEAFTAPHHGFLDAADYYYQASSLRVVGSIEIPTLILSAEDDPFVPFEQFKSSILDTNPSITTTITRNGGHCGFLAASTNNFDGYWAELVAVEFSSRHQKQFTLR